VVGGRTFAILKPPPCGSRIWLAVPVDFKKKIKSKRGGKEMAHKGKFDGGGGGRGSQKKQTKDRVAWVGGVCWEKGKKKHRRGPGISRAQGAGGGGQKTGER